MGDEVNERRETEDPWIRDPDPGRIYTEHQRWILVSDELLEEFLGWLEFAGPDHVRGVRGHCRDWPRIFTIQKRRHLPESRVTVFDVESPEFGWGGNWIPTFHTHDEIGPIVNEGGFDMDGCRW